MSWYWLLVNTILIQYGFANTSYLIWAPYWTRHLLLVESIRCILREIMLYGSKNARIISSSAWLVLWLNFQIIYFQCYSALYIDQRIIDIFSNYWIAHAWLDVFWAVDEWFGIILRHLGWVTDRKLLQLLTCLEYACAWGVLALTGIWPLIRLLPAHSQPAVVDADRRLAWTDHALLNVVAALLERSWLTRPTIRWTLDRGIGLRNASSILGGHGVVRFHQPLQAVSALLCCVPVHDSLLFLLAFVLLRQLAIRAVLTQNLPHVQRWLRRFLFRWQSSAVEIVLFWALGRLYDRISNEFAPHLV